VAGRPGGRRGVLGVLVVGPDAQGITYKLDGVTHTKPTAGPEGAYLIVTAASPTQLQPG
jgi:hypothetical protein